MGAVLNFSHQLETLTCGQCGMDFAVPVHWLNARRNEKENGGAFYCPNGHNRAFTESELDRVKRQLAEKERALAAEARVLAIRRSDPELSAADIAARLGVGTETVKSWLRAYRRANAQLGTF